MSIEKTVVVGSDSNLRAHLENYLRRCRYDVASAANIDTARDYLGCDNFDILFLDLSLPDGNAMDFLMEIQARPLKPLVVITGGAGSVESGGRLRQATAPLIILFALFPMNRLDSSFVRLKKWYAWSALIVCSARMARKMNILCWEAARTWKASRN